ncbi:MAG: hypothetical protein BWY74_04434 [Firmicutes bacterium ADurb.Bin419]|nr:MAG: hypothetical protein BWY74_04434 [Firmicutes bacterium ADurb.Bin419]
MIVPAFARAGIALVTSIYAISATGSPARTDALNLLTYESNGILTYSILQLYFSSRAAIAALPSSSVGVASHHADIFIVSPLRSIVSSAFLLLASGICVSLPASTGRLLLHPANDTIHAKHNINAKTFKNGFLIHFPPFVLQIFYIYKHIKYSFLGKSNFGYVINTML